MKVPGKIIFIGGAQRSGTTLVQKIVDSHSAVSSGGGEFHFTRDIFKLYGAMNSPLSIKQNKYYFSEGELKQKFHDFFLDFFQKNLDTDILSIKSPFSVEVSEMLLEFFPNSVYINVIRDFRDVFVSHLDMEKRAVEHGDSYKADLRAVAENWKYTIFKYNAVRKRKDLEGRHYNIHFEDFLREPEKQIQALCNFLDLDFEEHLLYPEKISAEKSKFITNTGNMYYTPDLYQQSFNTDKIGRWKKRLSFAQKTYAHYCAADYLKAEGYEVSSFDTTLNKVFNILNPQ